MGQGRLGASHAIGAALAKAFQCPQCRHPEYYILSEGRNNPSGGFFPPTYRCKDCGFMFFNPSAYKTGRQIGQRSS